MTHHEAGGARLKIAVSGSSGFVGSELCKTLEQSGHNVFRLSRRVTEDVLKDRLIAWDPANGLKNPSALSGFDAFFHLAGKSIADGRWSESVKDEIRESRVSATQTLAEQLVNVEQPPKVMLSASAVGIYGADSSGPIAEDTEIEPKGFLARVAQDWEAACDPLRCLGVRVMHPRLGLVLGKGGGALQKMLPLFRWGLGGRLGDGRQYWSWIGLVDCIRALIWLMETPTAVGPFNLVAPNPVTNIEFTQVLAAELKRLAIFPAPAFLLKAVLGEMAEALLLSGCQAVPEKLLRQGFTFEHSELANFLETELA